MLYAPVKPAQEKACPKTKHPKTNNRNPWVAPSPRHLARWAKPSCIWPVPRGPVAAFLSVLFILTRRTAEKAKERVKAEDLAFGGENFEFFSNINPVLIFFLTPLVAAMTSRARVYPMMMAGTLVMALPTFLLALPPSPVLLMSYILLMSIGEAMWQPRFLQLVAEIAPEGKTGAYMGIAQLPWFMTKVFVGFYAGWFVANYCPSVGPQNTEFMWLVYAFIAMVTPLGLWLAKGWIGSTMEQKAA